MIFDENYYKDRNVSSSIGERILHHDTQVRIINKQLETDNNVSPVSDLLKTGQEHFKKYCELRDSRE